MVSRRSVSGRQIFHDQIPLLEGTGFVTLCINIINPLKHTGKYMYHPLNIKQTAQFARRVYSRVPYDYHNKQR
jgi:hypothetical protein